ncbi:alpha/beta hydrolase [Tistrella bauzanensis]
MRRVVVFLHGYGADGQDLIGLAPFFAQVLPGTAFYAPDAPEPCEMSPFGRQWFGLDDYDPDLLRREPANMAAAHARMAAGSPGRPGRCAVSWRRRWKPTTSRPTGWR